MSLWRLFRQLLDSFWRSAIESPIWRSGIGFFFSVLLPIRYLNNRNIRRMTKEERHHLINNHDDIVLFHYYGNVVVDEDDVFNYRDNSSTTRSCNYPHDAPNSGCSHAFSNRSRIGTGACTSHSNYEAY